MRVGDRQRITRPTAPGLIDSRLNFTRRFRIRAQNWSFLRPFSLKLPLINFCRMLGYRALERAAFVDLRDRPERAPAPTVSTRPEDTHHRHPTQKPQNEEGRTPQVETRH